MAHDDEGQPRGMSEVIADLDKLRGELQKIVHGNDSHAGLINLMDDIYGNPKRQRRGLIPRIECVEKQVAQLSDLRVRDVTLMKGVAIGVGYVVADTSGLLGLIGRFFGALAP
jgi:hypothetical protein